MDITTTGALNFTMSTLGNTVHTSNCITTGLEESENSKQPTNKWTRKLTKNGVLCEAQDSMTCECIYTQVDISVFCVAYTAELSYYSIATTKQVQYFPV